MAAVGEGGTASADETELTPDRSEGEGEARPEPLAPGAAVGRFTLERLLGAGAMGEVWAARDPELDRTVAVKLLAPRWTSARARVRLLREGQALAKLRHENVVAVFDVGEERGRLYIAMELAEGENLADWMREKARSWREVRDVFVAAGRGLAAAHAAGIVHRDVKPGNVLVGPSGVRVVDFGLAARGDGPVSDTDGGSPEAANIPLTRTGKLVGTPVYMSPEQLRGERATPRSDQWSFCVALYEALYRRRPFSGEDVPALSAAIARGPTFAAGPPRSLVAVLRRGLSVDPEARFPSMDALVRAMARVGLGPRRAAATAGVAVAALVAVGGALGLLRSNTGDPCGGGGALAAEVWNDDARTKVRAAFSASGRPYAPDTFGRVDAALTAKADEWTRSHREACEATRVHHVQSDASLDLRMACLERARVQTRTFANLLAEVKGDGVDRALRAVADVGSVSACSDTAALAAVVPSPRDAKQAREVAEIRAEAERVEALLRLGRIQECLAAARALLPRANAAGHAPALADALMAAASAEGEGGDPGVALTHEYAAVRAAEDAHDDATRARALAKLVNTLGVLHRFAEAEAVARLAEAAVARAGNPPELMAFLLPREATVFSQKGDAAAAMLRFGEALALEEKLHGPATVAWARLLGMLANEESGLGNHAAAVAGFERALRAMETAAGPDSQDVAVMLINVGIAKVDAGDLEGAGQDYQRALSLRQRAFAADHPQVALIVTNLGVVRKVQGRLDEARALFERAERTDRAVAGGDEGPGLARDHENLAVVSRRQGRPEEALVHARRALAIREKADGPDSADFADAMTEVGRALVELHQLREARSALEKALAIRKKVFGENHDVVMESFLDLGDLAVAEGRAADALPSMERALAFMEKVQADLRAMTDARVRYAAVLLAAGQAARAVAVAEPAAAAAASQPFAPRLRADASFALARALVAAGEDRKRACALAAEARAIAAGEKYAGDPGEIAKWMKGAACP